MSRCWSHVGLKDKARGRCGPRMRVAGLSTIMLRKLLRMAGWETVWSP